MSVSRRGRTCPARSIRLRGEPAVDEEWRPAHEGRLVRAEEDDGRRHLAGVGDPLAGIGRLHLRAGGRRVVGAVEVLVDHRRLHVARADAVAADPVEGVVDGDRLRQPEDARLHRRVGREVAVAGEGEDGADVDDHAALAALPHRVDRVLAAPEGTGEVDRDELVPLLVRRLVEAALAEDPGVVNHQVEAAVLLAAARDRADDVLLARDVSLLEHGRAAGRAPLVDPGLPELRVTRERDDLRALRAERAQGLEAEPSRAARDDAGLTLEPHAGSHVGAGSIPPLRSGQPSASISFRSSSPEMTESAKWSCIQARCSQRLSTIRWKSQFGMSCCWTCSVMSDGSTSKTWSKRLTTTSVTRCASGGFSAA